MGICACACVRACMRVRVHARACAYMRAHARLQPLRSQTTTPACCMSATSQPGLNAVPVVTDAHMYMDSWAAVHGQLYMGSCTWIAGQLRRCMPACTCSTCMPVLYLLLATGYRLWTEPA